MSLPLPSEELQHLACASVIKLSESIPIPFDYFSYSVSSKCNDGFKHFSVLRFQGWAFLQDLEQLLSAKLVPLEPKASQPRHLLWHYLRCQCFKPPPKLRQRGSVDLT